MPDLDTPLHLNMFRASPSRRPRPVRALRALVSEWRADTFYGVEWGDPECLPPLMWVRDHWLRPYVRAGHTAVEIGPGGGRWTRYLLSFDRLYAIDYVPEILAEARRRFPQSHVSFVQNNGSDFPGVPPVEFVFSFGVFVHLDPPDISSYLTNIHRLLKPEGQAVLQYADKTKPLARKNTGFSDMTPERMRSMVTHHGFAVLEEDTGTLWHSSLIRFRPSAG